MFRWNRLQSLFRELPAGKQRRGGNSLPEKRQCASRWTSCGPPAFRLDGNLAPLETDRRGDINGSGSESAVRAWEDPVVIAHLPRRRAPDRNPMFLDKRVYQGSSGKVYPNPFTDQVRARSGQGIQGGPPRKRIHPADDPAGDRRPDSHRPGQDERLRLLLPPERDQAGAGGTVGPWISGGVEFNWPQHHRPSTFMPVDHSIEERPMAAALSG